MANTRKYSLNEGDRFGRLTLIEMHPPAKGGRPSRWLVRCDCGNEKLLIEPAIYKGTTRSCGCLKKENKGADYQDLVGATHELLRVESLSHSEFTGKCNTYYWNCVCTCGERVVLSSANFKRNKSCGHLSRERSPDAYSKTPTYNSWKSMLARCYNRNHDAYHNYGGRGIFVCPEWVNNFLKFREDMGVRPGLDYSLERVDNGKGYSKDNCVWATAKEQLRNTRVNRLVTFKGETKCLAEWCEELSIEYSKAHALLTRHNMTPEQVFTN